MTPWLILEANLHFNEKLKPIFTRDYRGDALTEGSDVYYGMHFVSAPPQVDPGESAIVRMVLRPYPIDPCVSFQPGKRISLKEGSVTRAEGVITSRREYNSAAKTIRDLSKELGGILNKP
jgi:hypothetical protein